MLVTMKTTMAGPDLIAHYGQKIDVPEDLASALIEGGFAIPANNAVESASIAAPETAIMPKPSRKRGK